MHSYGRLDEARKVVGEQVHCICMDECLNFGRTTMRSKSWCGWQSVRTSWVALKCVFATFCSGDPTGPYKCWSTYGQQTEHFGTFRPQISEQTRNLCSDHTLTNCCRMLCDRLYIQCTWHATENTSKGSQLIWDYFDLSYINNTIWICY